MNGQTTDRLLRSLSLRQVLVSAAVILLVGASLLLHARIAERTEDAEQLINRAGRQRMLSQRIALQVRELERQPLAAGRGPMRQRLRQAATSFEQAHAWLAEVVAELPAGSRIPAHFTAPDGVDALARDFLVHVRRIDEAADGALPAGDVQAVQALADEALLSALDRLTLLFQQESESGRQRLLYITRLSALLVLGAGLGIFRPVLARLRSDAVTRDRMARELDESRARFQSFSEASSDWYWETDTEHRLCWLRGSAQDELPFETRRILGHTRWELHRAELDEDAARWEAHRADLEAHRPFRDFEYRIADLDGQPRWLSVSGQPVFDPQGGFQGYRGVGRDVQERKRAQWRAASRSGVVEAMARGAAARDLLQRLVEMTRVELAAAVAIVEVDGGQSAVVARSGELGDALAAALGGDLRALSTPAAQAAGERRRVLAEHPDGGPWSAAYRQAAAGWQACWAEPILARGGTLFGVLVVHRASAAAPDDDALEVLQVTASLASICFAQVSSEDALRAVEAVTDSILDGAIDAIVTIDLDGRVVEFNPSAERMFGYGREIAVGRPVAELIIPERFRAAHAAGLARRRATGLSQVVGRRQEMVAIDAGGREFPIELSITHAPGVGLFAAFIRDLTEQKRTEEALRRSQKMQAVGQLTGGIAHDFNNLLGIIMGNLELIARRELDDALRKRVDTALKSTQRGADLTRRLLSFSRQSEPRIAPAAVALPDVLAGMLEMIERTLTSKIKVHAELDPATWPVAIAQDEFEDAVINLAINARDAMPQGGTLTLRLANRTVALDGDLAADGDLPAGDYAVLAVSDSGVGMAKEVVERIFEPFFTTKERGKGTGLGLAMVYGTVKRAGGAVRVYSEPGVGTTFRLFLPRAHGAAPARDPAATAPALSGGNEHVLVVDDESQLLDVAADTLRGLGYRVSTARSGAEALALVDRQPDIRLVVSDVVMAGVLDGLGLARALLARPARPRVLLTSGFAGCDEAALDDERLRHLVRTLLNKPYSRDDLARRVRAALDAAEGADVA